MKRNVVITGMGMLSSAGMTLEESRAHFIAGQCCLSPIQDRYPTFPKIRFAGLIPGSCATFMNVPPDLTSCDRHVLLAIQAGREALITSGIEPAKLGQRLGLIFSTCSGPMLLIEAHYERIIHGDRRLSEEGLFAKRYFSGARMLAHALEIQGLCTTVVTACSASTTAIAVAADLICCGLLDAALAGGSDAFALSTQAGFDGLKATAEGRCAPFSKPFGLNLGEAAAFVMLETAESAQQRGAPIRAELLGSGLSNDIYHCSSPEPSGRGLVAAMNRALQDAQLPPEQIAYINAHGTGTEANDKAECKAIRKVFGEHAAQIPLSSTKSMVGHCLGAAGAVETIASILCAEAGFLPPTANYSGPREGCALNCVATPQRSWLGPRTFITNNLAFGGHNASLVLSLPNQNRSGQTGIFRTEHESLAVGSGVSSERRTFSSGKQRRSNETPLQGCERPGLTRPSKTEPIYITACGVVSSLGIGVAPLLEGLCRKTSGMRWVSIPNLPPLQAGLIPEADVEKFDRRLDFRNMDRASRWATVAARLTVREARFPEKPAFLNELGFYLGLSGAPSWAENEYLTSFVTHHHQITQLMAFPYIVPGSVGGNVCRALSIAGHNLTLNAGPGAGLLGLGPALSALQNGHGEALLSGAVDELTERILTDQFMATGGLQEGWLPPGEGAVMFTLETESHLRERGGKPLAKVEGIAYGTEIEHRYHPDTDSRSLELVVQSALDQAGIPASAIGTWCASGPPARLRQIALQFCPAWMERRLDTAPYTGWLEGAQSLMDVAAALQLPDLGPILVLTSSPYGVNGAVVLKKIDRLA